GSLAVDDQIFGAACRQSGIIRLEKFNELFEIPKIFDTQPLPRGPRLGVVTFTGGVGVLAIDEAAKYDLSVSRLSPETSTRLNAIFPDLAKTIVDIGPPMAALSNYMDTYCKVLMTVLEDDTLDCIFNVIWTSPFESFVENYLKFYEEIRGRYRKTIASWIYGPSIPLLQKMSARMEDLGFPVFPDPETAIKALGVAYQYGVHKKGGA
ncbi:MAG: hypothetical protein ACUVWO_07270, partial [Thermodesulfobacteriota bacterium]